tara:strand:- start:192 stop:305 length:114 start_codon:yes stop_codon:yes gene_type:complete
MKSLRLTVAAGLMAVVGLSNTFASALAMAKKVFGGRL